MHTYIDTYIVLFDRSSDTPATPHGRTVTSGPPLTPPSYPGKTTRRQTMPSTPIWHYSTFHPYHRSTTAPWTWSPSPWRHGNTTSISHVTTRHDHSISHDVGSSGSAAKHGQGNRSSRYLLSPVFSSLPLSPLTFAPMKSFFRWPFSCCLLFLFIWNSLPQDLRHCSTLSSFKAKFHSISTLTTISTQFML